MAVAEDLVEVGVIVDGLGVFGQDGVIGDAILIHIKFTGGIQFVGPTSALRDLIAPGIPGALVINAIIALSKFGLQRILLIDLVDRISRFERHFQFAAQLPAPGGDQDHPPQSLGAVEGGGRSPFQYGNTLDIVGVDIVQPGFLIGSATVAVSPYIVADGNSIQDDQRLVVAGNGGEAADLNVGPGSRVAGVPADAQAR